MLARLGLAIVRPRDALTLAGNREHAGRSGTDLLVAMLVLVLVTQARAIVSSIWLASAVELSLGARAIVQLLTDAVAIDLGFLVIGALVIWAAAGPRRELGRAADLACVAVLPLVFVDGIATIIVLAAGVEVPRVLMTVLSLGAYTWTGALVALGALEARKVSRAIQVSPLGRRTGWAVAAITLVGLVVQGVWIARSFDGMRPVGSGDPAPEFALPRIEAKGALGPKVTLSAQRGKIVVVDFWATWCQPCVRSLPRLQALQTRHPDIAVSTINMDEPAEARDLFDEAGYTLTLLAANPEVVDHYDVGPIPHTVVIDPQGRVRLVHRGGKLDLEREISSLR
jgi:thiol-disulfide isomerase/thioredoxin